MTRDLKTIKESLFKHENIVIVISKEEIIIFHKTTILCQNQRSSLVNFSTTLYSRQVPPLGLALACNTTATQQPAERSPSSSLSEVVEDNLGS